MFAALTHFGTVARTRRLSAALGIDGSTATTCCLADQFGYNGIATSNGGGLGAHIAVGGSFG
jgi:hypothetical protein